MVERNRIINEDCIVGLKDLLRGGRLRIVLSQTHRI